MDEDKEIQAPKEKIEDAFFTMGFHGFDRLEKEFRADGWYYARASDFVNAKQEIISTKPHNCLSSNETACWTLGPLMLTLLIKDSVIVCHGPTACSSYWYNFLGMYGPKVMISTQLNDRDAFLGGGAKLRETLLEVIESYKPGMVAVVETCVSSITKDDLNGICAELEQAHQIPIIPFRGSGFRYPNWVIGFEEGFNMIIDRMKRSEEKNERSINFLNTPLVFHWRAFFEILPYLQRLGIKINTHTLSFLTFQEMIERYPRGALNVTRCPGQGLQCTEYAEKVLGIPYVRVPTPLSIKYTEQFIRKIADFFGLSAEAEALIQEEKARIAPRIDKARAKLQGKRVAIAAASGKNIALAQFATELGMEVIYLGLYKTDPMFHDLLRDWIHSTGQDPEVQGEASNYEIEASMYRLKPDFYWGLPEDRTSIGRLETIRLDHIGVAMNREHYGFEGAAQFAEYVVDLMENRMLRNWGKYFRRHYPQLSGEGFLRKSPLAVRACPKRQG